MGARRVIALINRKSYGDLMQGGQIDIAISPSYVTLSALLRFVRRGDVVVAHTLRRGAAEALEIDRARRRAHLARDRQARSSRSSCRAARPSARWCAAMATRRRC